MTTPKRVETVISRLTAVKYFDYGHNKAIRIKMRERLKSQQTDNIFPCALLILDDRERETGNQRRSVDLRIIFADFTRETLTTQERYENQLARLQPIAEEASDRFKNSPYFWYLPGTSAEIARVPFIGTEQLYEGTDSNLYSEPLDCIMLTIRGLIVGTDGQTCKRTTQFF